MRSRQESNDDECVMRAVEMLAEPARVLDATLRAKAVIAALESETGDVLEGENGDALQQEADIR
jgi:hypothetical protein